MTYRDDLAALAARHSALEHEVATKTKELERASRLLEEATARSRLPVLDNIRVASPCAADWSAMTGDERVRHCGDCKKNVYNLSEMTRDEAEALILAKEGRLCVRYFQRTDGTILLKDCLIGVKRRRRRRLVAAGAAAMLAGGGALALHTTRDEGCAYPIIVGEYWSPSTGGLAIDSPQARAIAAAQGIPQVDPAPQVPPNGEAAWHAVAGGVSPPPAVHELKGKLQVEKPPAKKNKVRNTR